MLLRVRWYCFTFSESPLAPLTAAALACDPAGFRYRPLPRAVRVDAGRLGHPVGGMSALPGRQSHGRTLQMNRRDMLKAGVAAGALGLAPDLASAQVTFAPTPKSWRSYVLTARVEPMDGATRAWIPLPTFAPADCQ